MSYQQAAAVIPKKDAIAFFQKYGYQLPQRNNLSPTEVGQFYRQVCQRYGQLAVSDLQQLAESNAKKLGGCACGGNCDSCASKKKHSAEGGSPWEEANTASDNLGATPPAPAPTGFSLSSFNPNMIFTNKGMKVIGAIGVGLLLLGLGYMAGRGDEARRTLHSMKS